ncbi:MAG: deoxyribose-phosphate aldolase [Ruminococcaceae bacterium]|nr:deoxyribose-phosphate aldolase [Oscillospiraceae bacterium]
MDSSAILRHVDHTQLQPTCTWAEIETLCDEAVCYKTASVCIPPCYVKRARATHPDLTVCTVIGFPLGYTPTAAKLGEIAGALADGADEIDMVVNLTDVKNAHWEAITEEIAAAKRVCGSRILKVIVETCYLTTEELITLCGCVTDGGADFIKTSTGFGTGGATMEDVLVMKAHIGPGVRIKASGGIRTRADMEAYLEAGCDRLGCSSAVKVLAPE